MAKYYVNFEDIKCLDFNTFKILMGVLNQVRYEESDGEAQKLPVPLKDMSEFLCTEEELTDKQAHEALEELEALGLIYLIWGDRKVFITINDELLIRHHRKKLKTGKTKQDK